MLSRRRARECVGAYRLPGIADSPPRVIGGRGLSGRSPKEDDDEEVKVEEEKEKEVMI